MTFNFTVKEFILGNGTPTLQFYKRGFELNSGGESPSWQDIILSGNTALTLVNSKADGLNYLKLFGGTEQRNLPSGFTQVEYLESDGNQYINTEYAPNVNTEVKINFSTTTLPSTDAYMFHSSDSGNARISLAITQHLVFFGGDLNDSSNRVTLPSFTENTAYDMTVNKDKVIVNGTEYNFTHTSVTLPMMGSIGLFGSRTGNLKCQGRVKSFSCNENNVLRINLIPCRRNSDSVLGMYDTVSNTFLTNAGTGSFIAGADVTTPSPDYPMDIVCNNGVVKARHQSGLPWGYTLLDYIESTGTQYINTGYLPNANTAISIKYYPAINYNFMCLYGTQDTTNANRFYGLISSTQFRVQVNSNAGQTPNFWGINNDGTLIDNINGTFAQTQGIVTLGVDNKNKVISVKSDEYTGNISASGTVLGDNLNCQYYLLLLTRGTAGVAANNFSGRLYSFTIKDNDVLVQNLIPAKRNSDNVIGMYDLVSQTFFTNAGTGDFIAGNTVSDPIAIYADGTVETVEVFGNNLIDLNAVTDGYYYDPSGTYTSSSTSRLTDYMHIEAGRSVAVYFKSLSAGTLNVRINIFNSNKVWQSQEVLQLAPNADGTKIITPTANGYIRVSANYTFPSYVDWDTAYVSEILGSATAEMLLKVGDYKDMQEVLSGSVTRNIGIKVLDGTENWSYGSSTFHWDAGPTGIASNAQVLCTSYVYRVSGNFTISGGNAWKLQLRDNRFTDVTTFTTWLAQQYNAGTPVIVVYPLATATTETVTAQPLTIQEGTNIVEITQSAIDNLGLEVSYKATV